MATRKILNIGTFANDGTGDTLRDAADKINHNFGELYASFSVQSVSSPANIDSSVGVVLITNAGFNVTIEDGDTIGQIKYIINTTTGGVTFNGNFLGGTTIAMSGNIAIQIIWTGIKWALVTSSGATVQP